MADLVTLAQVQTAYPKMTAAVLADVPQVIAGVTAEIVRRFPRAAPLATRDETHRPDYSRTITLRPNVRRVNRVRTYLAPVLNVQRTGPARRATAEAVTTGDPETGQAVTGLSLASQAAGVNAPAQLLTFDVYPTLDALAAAVSALTGWTATVAPNQGDMATADLEPNEGPRPATGGGARLYAYTTELADWNLTDPAGGELLLYEYRSPGFRFPDHQGGADPRTTGYRVNYDAGLSPVPDDIVRAALIAVADNIEATEHPGHVRMENEGGTYSYRVTNPTYRLPDVAERILRGYKARGF